MLFLLGRFDEAIASFDRAISINPLSADAYYNRGATLKELRRFEEALADLDAAVASRPDRAESHNLRGIVLRELGQLASSLDAHDRALVLKPTYLDAMVDRANCLFDLNRIEEALDAYNNVLRLDPEHLDAHFCRANVLRDLGRTSEALDEFDKTLAISPNLSKAVYNRARLILMLGDLSEGWHGNERRFEQPGAGKRWLASSCPTWTGQSLSGKRIVVYDEQGMGDVIQFARYLINLTNLGAEVTFVTLPRMHRLLRTLPISVKLMGKEPEQKFDFQCQLLGLPKIFKTSLETIPNYVQYLSAESELVSKWKAQIDDKSFNVGIVWQGNPVGKIDVGRSIPLHEFLPLSQITGINLVSLQKNHGLDQLTSISEGMHIQTLPGFDEGEDAFVDTAAVMKNLDLIITSDTSTAHLAGALGRPVWLALQLVPDWRWLLEGEISPWYPTMRLYRQSARGDWSGVFAKMTGDLRTLRSAS